MNLLSVKTRFLVSVGANVARAGISFLTGVLVARGLSPIGYGDLFFLLGSFTAIRALTDLGASQAFYTFISQEIRSKAFYLLYFAWLALQFVVIVLLVIVILPDALIDKIWLGHYREIILLAFLASFMQQQVWATVIQVCEAVRKTVLVQSVGLSVVLVHLAVVLLLMWAQWLSIQTVFFALLGEYLIAALVIWALLRRKADEKFLVDHAEDFNIKKVLFEYWVFCRPLIIIAFLSFLYEFLDRWLLQRFGGAEQQGFYQISAQFAVVSLLATMSILNIFWKEIAEANKQNNHERVRRLYHKVSRSLLMLGAVISCFLIPWAEELTVLLLGEAYSNAWPVLAVMFLYPVHQSMGQINAAMFMACERTKPYMYLSVLGMMVSMPVTIFLLAPPDAWFISGLGLGALGLAIKMVGLNILFVNLQGWFLSRFHQWKYDWGYQMEGLFALLALSVIIKFSLVALMGGEMPIEMDNLFVLLMLFFSGLIYLFAVCFYVWLRPSLFGLDREDIGKLINLVVRRT